MSKNNIRGGNRSKSSGGDEQGLSGFRVSIPASMRPVIQSIRETTGKQHSDEEIYSVLRDCSMDPNETAQKLLYLGIRPVHSSIYCQSISKCSSTSCFCIWIFVIIRTELLFLCVFNVGFCLYVTLQVFFYSQLRDMEAFCLFA